MAVLLFVLLFADGVCGSAPGFIGSALREVAAIFRDPGTQWMIFLCLGVYFTVFLFLRSRIAAGFWRATTPNLWLAGALLISAVLYAIGYSPSLDALTLLAGALLGQGLAVWVGFNANKPSQPSTSSFPLLLVSLLVILLALASVWNVGSGYSFEYRGHARWSGPWDNPNLYGLLMGVGTVLAAGLIISGVRCQVSGENDGKKRTWKLRNGKHLKWLLVMVCLFAAILMGRALLHSYCRGAWLAAICGLAYLFWSSVQSPKPKGQGHWIYWLKKNWLPFSVTLASAFALSVWQFQHTEHENMVARRAFSVGNVNDFSWRNRLAYWEGALQIMAEKPWFGFGWNQPGPIYDQYYRTPKVVESRAIQLNDYLMLGATLGIPALFCFGMYLWLSLARKAGGGNQKSKITELDSLQATCRAGAIVLLVGFWFDGGLFKLPTAMTFWILLELGSVELPQKAAKQTNEVF